MKFQKTPLKNAYLITLEPWKDKRGFFERLFCQKTFRQTGLKKPIVQVNYSLTKKAGIVRGLHYQLPPYTEVKIVTCLVGKIFDCIVDLRKNSPTFLKWYGVILSEENQKMLYVPEGFAHGLQALADNSTTLYLNTNAFHQSHERGLHYNDPLIGIKWKLKPTEVSRKDNQRPLLKRDFKGI